MAAADPAPPVAGVPARRGVLARLAPRRSRPPALIAEAIPFQDDLDELLAQPAPLFLRGVHWIAVLGFVGMVALSCVVKVDVVVTGNGRLTTDAPPIVLQPFDRAVIRELRVRPGDVVRAGQVLALLDATFTEADRAALESQRRALGAQLARVVAEAAGREPPAPELNDMDALLQAALHARRRSLLTARLRAMDQEMQVARTTLRSLEERDGMLAEQVAIARDVERMRAELMRTQIGSRLNWLAARQQRLQAEQEQEEGRTRMRELQHGLAAKEADRVAFTDDWRRMLLEEEVRLRGEVGRLDEALAKARRMDALTTVTAPEDGVVVDVARRSVGSVLREAEPLVIMVPAGVPLVAEIGLRSADIGVVQAGDPVDVKVDAFPFQRHGLLQGRLRAIVQDSQPAQPGEPHAGAALHRAMVEITDPSLERLPEGARLTPGMTVAGEFRTGTRRVVSYILQPLIRGARESLREP